MTNTTETTVAPVKASKAKGKKAAAKKVAAKSAGPREGSKVAKLIAAMRTAKGISTDEAAKQFKWETKSIRGVISGTIRAKLKLNVMTEQDDKRGNVYRIKK